MTYNAAPGEVVVGGGDLERVVMKARLPQKHLETVKLSPSPQLHIFIHFSSAFTTASESFVTRRALFSF